MMDERGHRCASGSVCLRSGDEGVRVCVRVGVFEEWRTTVISEGRRYLDDALYLGL